MAPSDKQETKAGHPAAIKISGVRKPHKVRRASENESKTEEPEDVAAESPEEQEAASKGGETGRAVQNTVSNTGAEIDVKKAFPTEALQQMQHKPRPSNEPSNRPASARPNIIQQPRK